MAHKIKCGKCNGTGNIQAFSHIVGGVCFACEGKGHKILKNKPRPSILFSVGAADREDGEIVFPIFNFKAPNEKAALKKAKIQLASGTGFHVDTAFVKENN